MQILPAKRAVPRETSCIPASALLDFRCEVTFVPNHRDCEPKRRGWKDYDSGKPSRLPCYR